MRQLVLMFACLAVAVTQAAAPPVENPQTVYKRLRKEAFSKGRVELEYGPRYIAHADRYPNDPSAVEALLEAAGMEFYARPQAPTGKAALTRLEKHYARSPIVEPLLLNLGMSNGVVETTFLRQIGETNPDLRIRALAWRAVIYGRTSYISKEQPMVDQGSYKGRFLDVAKANLATWRKEIDEAREELKTTPLVGLLPDVSVGAKAPATEAIDLEGNKVLLADHKGKVVVLDFWHLHNDSYLKHVPALNARIRELKGKPFVQIGVSFEDRATVRNFVKNRQMAWTHWSIDFNGKQYVDWDILQFPTAYVIDHEGVIRHHQVGFSGEKDKLNDIVRELVKKAEAARK